MWGICAWTGPASTPATAATAAYKTLMGCSLDFPAIYHRAGRDAKQRRRVLKTVRLAGLRRLRPIVPDRTAFGAAIERETHGDHAENQCQPPEHGRHAPLPPSYGRKSGIFKPREMSAAANAPDGPPAQPGEDQRSCNEQPAAEFDIEEARRVLGDVFAPWVQDLGLSIERHRDARRRPAPRADWQPGAILRMAFSERLCRQRRHRLRSGADGARRHRDGDRHSGRQPRLPADDDGRSDHAFHARGHLVRRAGGRAGGSARAHHELSAASRCRAPPTTGRWRWYRALLRCCETRSGAIARASS